MARQVRLFPHRTADQDALTLYAWWYLDGDQEVELPPLIEAWDYRTVLEVGIDFKIDWELLSVSTGLNDRSLIDLVLIADCPASQFRVGEKIDLSQVEDGEIYSGSFELPAGRLAESVELSAHLVLANDTEPDGGFTAAKAGSRLFSSMAYKVALEGSGSRFPVEPVSFKDTNRASVPWQLSANTADLGASFLGNVRLYVNTDHAVGRMLLDATTVDRVKGLVMADLIRLLVAQLVAESGGAPDGSPGVEEFENSRQIDGSIAHVMDDICYFYLKMNLLQALTLYATRPVAFDEVLHERLDPTTKLYA